MAELGSFINELAKEGFIVEKWGNELRRLRLWAWDIGANKLGDSSLDSRLRDAPHIYQQIMRLFDDLRRTVRDAQNVLIESESDADDDFSDSSQNNEDAKTEIQQLQESLANTASCLIQMSMPVCKLGQLHLILGSKHDKIDCDQSVDIKKVSEKYGNADEGFVSRLGHANTLRREYLGSCKRYAPTYKREIDITYQDGEACAGRKATQFKSNIAIDNRTLDSGEKQTMCAQTWMSSGNLTVPSPPKVIEEGLPFECPYCHFVITVQSTRSWNNHVFKDLRPYICTNLTCVRELELFATRREWIRHMKELHPRNFTASNVVGESGSSADCPLCEESLRPGKQYARHVARHLQELALSILPREEEQEASEKGHGTGVGPRIGSSSHVESANSDPAVHPKSNGQPTSPSPLADTSIITEQEDRSEIQVSHILAEHVFHDD